MIHIVAPIIKLCTDALLLQDVLQIPGTGQQHILPGTLAHHEEHLSFTATPKSVFSELGVDTSTSMVNLDGTPLSGADFNKTFEELGVEDGSTASLNAIVKADGARA